MILGLLFFLVSLIFGIGIMLKIKFAKGIFLKIVFGFPVGIVISTFILLIFYIINGSFTNGIFYITLLLLALFSLVLYYPFKYKTYPLIEKTGNKNEEKGLKKAIIGGLAVYAIIAEVLLTSMYFNNGTLYCVGPAICSDLMYHIGIGNSIIYTNFPPKYLFTMGSKNVFPFISDFYTAVLMKYGLNLRWASILPYLILFFSAVFGTDFLIYKLTKNAFITVASLFIFWFGSDYFMALVLYSISVVNHSIPIVILPFETLLREYGLQINSTPMAILTTTEFIVSGWTSIFYQMLLPQRDFVLGLPIGIMLLYAIYEIAFEKIQYNKLELIFLGVMAGTLPLVHPVTLEVISVFGIFSFLYMAREKQSRPKAIRALLWILIPLVAIAIPQLVYMTSQKLASGWYKFIYQAYVPYTGNLLLSIIYGIVNIAIYWIELVGLPLILAIFGLKLAPRKLKEMFLPFLLLWMLITVYSIQPNPEDSNKVFLYVFLILSVLASYPLFWLYKKRNKFLKISSIILIALISFNFVLVYGHWLLSPLPWITKAAFGAVDFILNNTSNSAVFAVSNNESLLQTVSSLAYRQTIISIEPYVEMDEHTYPLSLLNSINYQIVEMGNCSVIKKYNVSYVFYQEPNSTGIKAFDNKNFTLVYNTTDRLRDRIIAIFKVVC